jgi:hypothetical protein
MHTTRHHSRVYVKEVGWRLLFVIIVFAIAAYNNPDDYLHSAESAFIFGLVFCLDAISALVVHLQYWKLNRMLAVATEPQTGTIRFRQGLEEASISTKDLTATVFMTNSRYRGTGFSLLAFDHYHWTAVRNSAGDTLVITSLLVADLEQWLGDCGIPYERKRVGYPLVSPEYAQPKQPLNL